MSSSPQSHPKPTSKNAVETQISVIAAPHVHTDFKPWWMATPSVLMQTLIVLLAPFRLITFLVETVISLTALAVIVAATLWWIGTIPDEMVLSVLLTLITRASRIAGGLGLF